MIKDSLFCSKLKVICNNVNKTEKVTLLVYCYQNTILGLISNKGLRTKSLEAK